MAVLSLRGAQPVEAPIDPADALALWERWTIDDLADGVARVLVSPAVDLSRWPLTATSLGSTDDTVRARRAAARSLIMDVEIRPLAESFGEEEPAYVETGLLFKFLRARDRTEGLPGTRPLREGDAFWVTLAAGTGVSPGGANVPLAGRLEALQAAGARVWDVTAAARAAAKHAYHATVAVASDRPARRTPAGHGSPTGG